MKLLWFRVLMMSISFIFVVIAIRKLNNRTYEPHIASAIGLPGSSRSDVSLAGNLNWCETRVESLKLAGGVEILQEKLKWVRTNQSETTKLQDVAVEKWFGKNCTVETELVAEISGEIPKKVMTIAFIKGELKTLLRYPTGEFVWQGQTFRSPQLAAALQDLESLPVAENTGLVK